MFWNFILTLFLVHTKAFWMITSLMLYLKKNFSFNLIFWSKWPAKQAYLAKTFLGKSCMQTRKVALP